MTAWARRVWLAWYFDGVTAKREAVRLVASPEGLIFESETIHSRLWPWDQLHQTQGCYAGEPVRLERPEQSMEALVVDSPEFVQVLRKAAPRSGQFRAPLPRRGTVAIAVVAVAVTLFAAAILYLRGIPYIAGAMAKALPIWAEERLGTAALQVIAPEDRRCNDPVLQTRLDALVRRLAAAEPASHYSFRVVVADRPIVNAAALPGGRVVVFRGLLEKTKDPQELAGVLAHELQHVFRHHVTAALLRTLSTRALLSSLGSDASNVLEPAELLGNLRFSRIAEAEADREGLTLMSRAGLDGRKMVDVFRTLQQHSHEVPSTLSFLEDHPSIENRIRILESLLPAVPGPVRPLELSEPWRGTIARCTAD